MKCGTYIQWKMVGRKKPVKRIHRSYTPHHVAVYGFQKTDDMELCDGDIYPNAELDYDGYGGCGCCGGDYRIEVKFVCDKCGSIHQEFPKDEHWYNQFVRDLIDGKNIDEIRSELIKKQEEHQKTVLAMIEKQKKEQESRNAINLARKANKLKGKV